MLRASLGILIVVLLSSCNNYSLPEAKKNGDIIVGPGGLLNTEKITQFMNDVDKHQDSKLRVTSYTVEGDPIISDLHYDGKMIRYSFNTSQDKHGGSSKGKSETTCEKIVKKEITRADNNVQKGTQYVLDGCKEIIGLHESDKNEIHVLFVPQQQN